MSAAPPASSSRQPRRRNGPVVARWIAALLALVGVLTFLYAGLFQYSFTQWLKPDYSHGFLVPIFAVYLAYHWRDWAPGRIKWPEPWGLAFLAGGTVLFVVAGRFNIAKEWLQGLSLVLNLSGAALLLGGWPTLRWLAPCFAFLMFMFPLPNLIEHKLGWQLQSVAAIASEFALQAIGYPTYREGVVLYVKDHVLEVEKACSGLSMLLTFLALSTGMALLVKRSWFDRVLILVSAVPVAVLSNVIRIALTGVLYNEAGKELGDRVFHDFAGWMMMPFAAVDPVGRVEAPRLGVGGCGRPGQPRGDDPAERDEPGLPGDDSAAAGKGRDELYLLRRHSRPGSRRCRHRRRPPLVPPKGSADVATATAARGFAWILLGVAAFTVYGSLVPFHFRALSLSDAFDAFRAVLAAGVKIESRSDAARERDARHPARLRHSWAWSVRRSRAGPARLKVGLVRALPPAGVRAVRRVRRVLPTVHDRAHVLGVRYRRSNARFGRGNGRVGAVRAGAHRPRARHLDPSRPERRRAAPAGVCGAARVHSNAPVRRERQPGEPVPQVPRRRREVRPVRRVQRPRRRRAVGRDRQAREARRAVLPHRTARLAFERTNRALEYCPRGSRGPRTECVPGSAADS